MARKNPFANIMSHDEPVQEEAALNYAAKGASRSLLSSIDEMKERTDRLMEGEPVVELDPDIVDPSFLKDRMDDDNEDEFIELREAIRSRGQDSPILVRPHPSQVGRYMVVFGHRRLKAAAALGRKVRAVIKNLKDIEHVVAQGQENSARADLSFIEKALYAADMAKHKFDDDNSIILTALSIDRATLSKMLSVANLPGKVLRAIGPAKSVGRDRWYELKLLLEKPANYDAASAMVDQDEFKARSTDQRFHMLVALLKTKKPRARAGADKRNWSPEDGLVFAEMKVEGKGFNLALKAKGRDAAAFGDYLSANLDRLYTDFRKEANSKGAD